MVKSNGLDIEDIRDESTVLQSGIIRAANFCGVEMRSPVPLGRGLKKRQTMGALAQDRVRYNG